jgi:hypothetical protein
MVEKSTKEKTLNEVRDTIHISLSLAEYTKLPFLLLGNPGIAKTTILRSWAESKGYKVVSLIGSQRTAEEILGYQVRVDDPSTKVGVRLVTVTPDWYDEIVEYHDAGHKTILFIDEISQAPENVQGAMLQLIFDRKTGGRNYLPEDTLIISAANYKANLPPQMTMQAPTLNRFVIVNVEPADGVGYAEEFLQPIDTRNDKLIDFQDIEITPKVAECCRVNVLSMMTRLFTSYAIVEGTSPVLDVKAQNFNEIFEADGKIYNFISGRTMHYLYQVALGLIHLGICRRRYAAKISNLVLGLIGNGTNSFKNENDIRDYRKSLTLDFQKVLTNTINSTTLVSNPTKLNFTSMTVADAINNWILYTNGAEVTYDDNFKELVEKITTTYKTDVKGMGVLLGTLKTKDDMIQFTNDLQKVEHLVAMLDATSLTDIQPARKAVKEVQEAWRGYRSGILAKVIKA